MGLLIQEFFGKIWDFINEINFFLMRWIVKLIFYVLAVAIIISLILLFYTKNGYIVLIFLGTYILAEIFHFIRKLREKIMTERMIKAESVNIKKKRKSKN
jgi:hypothetical protein